MLFELSIAFCGMRKYNVGESLCVMDGRVKYTFHLLMFACPKGMKKMMIFAQSFSLI